MRLTVLALFACAAIQAQMTATAERGPAILKEQGCAGCHATGGAASTVSAQALTRPLNREYTPAGLTATLWNHAPQMFAAIAREKARVPALTDQDAADLFAYFASLRYFEPAGDSTRGARLFESKKCVVCHGDSGPGVPLAKWAAIHDPIELAGKMWNHLPQMREEMAKRKIKHPSLTAQELTDILLYARSQPGVSKNIAYFQMPSLEGAEKLMESTGCAGCHKGDWQVNRLTKGMSTTEIAASMWNHGQQMSKAPTAIPPEDIRKIVTWVWTRQIVSPEGDIARGKKFAESRQCMTCHSGGGAGPSFAKLSKPYTVIHATSGLWKHGPVMLAAMQQKNFKWPKFTPQNIEDLLAFMNSVK